MRTLEINKDYGFVFGLDADKGQHLIYKGENRWLAQQPGAEREIESPGTTAKALEYISAPTSGNGIR